MKKKLLTIGLLAGSLLMGGCATRYYRYHDDYYRTPRYHDRDDRHHHRDHDRDRDRDHRDDRH